MDIDDVVRRLFDGLEEYEPNPEEWDAKLAEARGELEKLREERGWTYERLDEWCWADSNRAFGYIFGGGYDVLDEFTGSKIDITKDGGNAKGTITLDSGDKVLIDMSLDHTGLEDYWQGFSYGKNEFDINIWSNDSFGGESASGYSARVYPVGEYGHTEAKFGVPVIVTKVEEI